MSTALRSVGFLDVLSSTPAESSRRAPCINARLRRLATKAREKCGLELDFLQIPRNEKPGLGDGLNVLDGQSGIELFQQ